MRLTVLWVSTVLAVGVLFSTAARAERTCEENASNVEHAVQANQMAELVLSKLEAERDDVVLIGLVAQDLSQYGLEYSHMGLAVRRATSWRVSHVLNPCGGVQSSLQDHSLVDFLSDKPFQYKVALWRLQPALQARLAKALSSKAAKRMHEPKYSMVAYPFSTQYQNTTAWVMEMLAHSLALPSDDVVTREDAQGWLKNAGFAPTQLPMGMLTRLGARIARSNVVFDDHPPELRWTNKIHTTTPDAVIAFLKKTPNACLNNGCVPAVVVLPLREEPAAPPSAVQALSIKAQHASTFSDNNMEPYVAVGDRNQLTATAAPAQSRPRLEWQSSNPAALAVDRHSGLVTGVAPGTAEITATDTVSHVSSAPLHLTALADVDAVGLTWKITAFKGSFDAANAYCAARGWRLPTLDEARVVRFSSAYTGEPKEDFDGVFDAWRFLSEFRTSASGAARSHADWYWHPRGGKARPIEIPDSVGSYVLCVHARS